MGIQLGSNFTQNAALPLDDRDQVADLTARDAIPSGRRWEGMKVYVLSEELTFKLVGGITDGDWVEDGGGSGSGILTVADTTARDAIDPSERYEGLLVYVIDIETNYQLRGGITDGDWADLTPVSTPTVFGTRAAPRSVVAATGITSGASHMSTTATSQTIFVEGSISGESDVSANPQIQAGTIVGQTIILIGRDSDDYIKLEHGTGLDHAGESPWFSFAGCSIFYIWDGTNWYELWRRG